MGSRAAQGLDPAQGDEAPGREAEALRATQHGAKTGSPAAASMGLPQTGTAASVGREVTAPDRGRQGGPACGHADPGRRREVR